MTVSGVNTSVTDLLAARIGQATARPVEQQPRPAAAPALVAPSAAPSADSAAQANAVQAPPGTDPALWSVLTGAERSFFAKHVNAGPLTYSKMMLVKHPPASAAPSIVGGRVDVRA
jgi:hypothetical protein